MVVDDNGDDRETYSKILFYNNFDVLPATSAGQAVRMATLTRPDAILLNLNLGDVHRLTPITMLQNDAATRDIPIVCLANFELSTNLAPIVGCTAVLQKPVSAVVLVSTLWRVLRDPNEPSFSDSDEQARSPGASPQRRMNEKVVLLVEDNDDTRAIYGALLKRSGYQVLEAVDGGMAVTMMTWVKPQLVLLDIALPRLDGWAVARWAKSGIETSGVPIVAVTALSRAEHRVQADQCDFAEYLTKPVEPRDLLNCVQRLIGPVAEPDTSVTADVST